MPPDSWRLWRPKLERAIPRRVTAVSSPPPVACVAPAPTRPSQTGGPPRPSPADHRRSHHGPGRGPGPDSGFHVHGYPAPHPRRSGSSDPHGPPCRPPGQHADHRSARASPGRVCIPRFRTAADRRPLTPGSRKCATGQIKHATAFLSWLSGHYLTSPHAIRPTLTAGTSNARSATGTPTGASCCGARPPNSPGAFGLSPPQARRAAPLSQKEREPSRPASHRRRPAAAEPFAAVIVLLYAQPCSRVVHLTIDDVVHDNDQVLLRLGEPASPMPAPCTAIDNGDNMNTATHRDSRWLLPGRRAGRLLPPGAFSGQLNGLGIPTAAAPTEAIRQQVLEMSAPVAADALATTTTPPPDSSARLTRSGADTPPATTHGHQEGGLRRKLTEVELRLGVTSQEHSLICHCLRKSSASARGCHRGGERARISPGPCAVWPCCKMPGLAEPAAAVE